MKIIKNLGVRIIMSDYEYFKCSKSEAIKMVSDFMSDTRKDIEPVKRRRVSTAATIFGITVACASFAVPTDLPEANIIRTIIFAAGVSLFDKNNVDSKELLLKKEQLLIEAERYRGELHEANDNLYMPNNLEQFLLDHIEPKKLEYLAWGNRWHAISRIGLSVACSVSMAFSAAGYYNREQTQDNQQQQNQQSDEAILPKPQKTAKPKAIAP